MKVSMVESNFVILQATNWAFTTRRINQEDIEGLEPDVSRAMPGDPLLGRQD